MHIDVQGNGPDLVLIHGWAMHGGVFAPLLERLAPRFRVHLVDLPGHGRSRDETDFDAADCARRIAAATPRALWVGWSLGGTVALRAALDTATRARGLALIASSPRFVAAPDWLHGVPMDVFTAFGSDLEARYRDAIERFLALETMGSPHAQAELRELKQQVFERGEPSVAALQDGLRTLETEDLRDDLARLSMPSLWIAGRRDRLVAPEAMRWAAGHAPGGRYLELNSGHAPFIGHADAVAAAIAAFDKELPA
ncbi:pimeloyl-ACP methyl ester esterase BioH [Dokdonella sp.]|uniref:pimeloyl-ACP methyl ester esterase BioH n=1 Tax=Dokdonella sp. TaxID=2291710 RepID=UPI0026021D77|nr:pimeloyl-ACP methyl ester esterase BioH [Dokdonella sp.]